MRTSGGGAEAGAQLGPLFRRMHDDYLQLLTGLPECIEAYEASSASGATLRRFAIVQDAVRSQEAPQLKGGTILFRPPVASLGLSPCKKKIKKNRRAKCSSCHNSTSHNRTQPVSGYQAGR